MSTACPCAALVLCGLMQPHDGERGGGPMSVEHDLILPGITRRGGRWAVFSAANPGFALALRGGLSPEAEITAVQRDRRARGPLPPAPPPRPAAAAPPPPRAVPPRPVLREPFG